MTRRLKTVKGRIGFANHAVKGGYDELLSFSTRHGFDLVQIGLDSSRFFPERMKEKRRKIVAGEFSRRDIALCFHGPSDIPLMNRHAKIRFAGLERYFEMIDLAVDLGGEYFIIHPGRLAFYSVAKKQVIFMERKLPGLHVSLFEDSLRKLLHYSKERISLCMENTHGLPPQFLNILSALADEEGLGLVWDTGHTEMAPPAQRERTIKFFQDNLKAVKLGHLHDVSDGADHKQLGTGEINVDGYIEIFNTMGIDIVLEVFPHDQLLRSAEYLRNHQAIRIK